MSSIDGPLDGLDASRAAKRYQGAFILQVGNIPTFSCQDVIDAINHYANLPVPPRELVVRLGTDLRSDLIDDRPPLLHMRPVDIRRVAAILSFVGEGEHSSSSSSSSFFPHLHLRQLVRDMAATPPLDFTPPDPDDLVYPTTDEECIEIRRLQNKHMTDEEKALPSFTWKNLIRLSNWQEWRDADDKQLDAHFDAGTIGMAVPRPKHDPMTPSQVFRLVWNRLVKATRVRKS